MYFRQNGYLTQCLWKDSKVMSTLSNRHQAYGNKTRQFQSR